MIKAENLRVYLAVKSRIERSQMEDALALDRFDVRAFTTASELWNVFQQSPVRFVISDRRFGDDFGGVDLARKIRAQYMLPYVFIVMLSTMNRIKEIRDALGVGVDDYLVKPSNRLQLRTRMLVGTRWLNYIDSLYESNSVGKQGKKVAA